MPLLGTLTFIGALSLAGTPPFNIFISEFTVLKAAVDKGLWLAGPFPFFARLFSTGCFQLSEGCFLERQRSEKWRWRTASIGTGNAASLSFRLSMSSGFINDTIMILSWRSLLFVLGFTVPGFIDGTIRTCIDVLGVK